MRARLAVVVTAALALAGCSLLLSDDLAGEGTPPPGEAGADTTTGTRDTGSPDVASLVDAGGNADADADAPFDPSLVAFWTFDNGMALVQKDETNRYDLALGGASIDPAGGIRGGAAVFSGSTSPRVEALSAASYPKKGTLSFWFKYTFADDDMSNRGLFDNWDSQRSHMFIRRLGSETPGRFQTALQPLVTNSSYAWTQSFDTQKDKWTHVVMTWDSMGRTAALYVDGVTVKTSSFITGENFDPDQQDFRFGAGFAGAVDEIRLYDRVMPTAEALLLP